jgi:ribosomal protein S18 acetylase RimI-like enzyme
MTRLIVVEQTNRPLCKRSWRIAGGISGYDSTFTMIRFRPATADDTEFLWHVQRSALGPYVLAQFGTSELQQRAYFDEHFEITKHLIVALGGDDVGLLSWENRGTHIYLENIAILPDHQSQGIGTTLITGVLEEAETQRLGVRLQVLKPNVRAQALYKRLGFNEAGESETHVLMQWNAPPIVTPKP